MFRARNSDSKTPLKKWNQAPGTDFRLKVKSLWYIFLMHPVQYKPHGPIGKLTKSQRAFRSPSYSALRQPSGYRLIIYRFANIVWFSITIAFFFENITQYLIMKYWCILAFQWTCVLYDFFTNFTLMLHFLQFTHIFYQIGNIANIVW